MDSCSMPHFPNATPCEPEREIFAGPGNGITNLWLAKAAPKPGEAGRWAPSELCGLEIPEQASETVG